MICSFPDNEATVVRVAPALAEQRRDLVVGNHTPEGARVGSADRLAFIDQRGAAEQQCGGYQRDLAVDLT